MFKVVAIGFARPSRKLCLAALENGGVRVCGAFCAFFACLLTCLLARTHAARLVDISSSQRGKSASAGT